MNLQSSLRSPHSVRNACSAFFTAALLGSSLPLLSQNFWSGANDGTTWNNAGNWTGGIPASTAVIALGDNPPNAAQTLTLGGVTTISNQLRLDGSGNRDYTITGGTLNFLKDGSSPSINSNNGTGSLTIKSAMTLGYQSGTGTDALNITGTAARTINFEGNITSTGPRINLNAANVRLNLKGNNSGFLFQISAGEAVAYTSTALGGNQLQGGNNAYLSLASDLELAVPGGASTFLAGNVNVRIREETASSLDRTMTFTGRLVSSSTNGKMTIVDNINSTGRVILNATYSGATAQSLAVDLGNTGVLRFGQTGATRYGPASAGGGVISGNGTLEVTNGGSVTLYSNNTYTGKTTVSNGSLVLSSTTFESVVYSGKIAGTSELNLAAGTSFNIAGVAEAGYAFGSAQGLSGAGTVVAGTKNLTLNGSLAPGNGAGTLTFDMGTGALILGSDATLLFDLGSTSDLVLLTSGALNIGSGTLDFGSFDFNTLSGFGQGTYTLFQTSKVIAGSFGGVTSGLIGDYVGELRIAGNNLVLDVIPEPGTAALFLLLGFPAACRKIWRQRRA